MIKVFGPKRSKSFRNKYLALALIGLAFFSTASCYSQLAGGGFTSTDSLRKYAAQNLRGGAVQAFSQQRLYILVQGMINWIDSARVGEGGEIGITDIIALNDSTIRLTKNGVNQNVTIKGTQRSGVDTLYKPNDSTLAFNIGGETYNVSVADYSPTDVTKEYVDSLFSSLPSAIVYLGGGLTGQNTIDSPIAIDTSENMIATKSDVLLARDSIGKTPGIDSFQVYRAGVHVYSVPDTAGSGGVGDGLGVDGVETDGVTTLGDGKPGNPVTVDTSTVATQWWVSQIPGTTIQIFQGPGITVTGNSSIGYTITNTGSPGSNPMNALDIRTYGGIANVSVPSSGNNVTGTDNTPFLQAALNAAASGQVVIVPDGNWLFATPLDTIQSSKRVNILIMGNTYHNGSDFAIFANAGGAFEQHSIVHFGVCIGRVNMPQHTRATYTAGTAPQWSTFTGTPFKVYNSAMVNIQFTEIQGFKNGIELIGHDYDGAERGVMEITVAGKKLYKNANGITLTSLNGRSYVNQSTFGGVNGGPLRISGGLGLKIDGYSGTAFNGEIFNGAFRNHEFHFMAESLDSIVSAHGDISECLFDITVEQNIFGNTAFSMRSVSPNFVRSPTYMGKGVLEDTKIAGGMGINGVIMMPIWNSPNGRYYTNYARIDDEGYIVIVGSKLTKGQRDQAPSIFRFAPGLEAETDVSITAATYTVATKVRYVFYNHASGTLTFPAANTNTQRVVTVFNDNANPLTVANVSAETSIPGGDVMAYRSNGVTWKPILNPEGTDPGGSSIFTADANGQTTTHKLGLRTASVSGASAAFAASTTSVASYVVQHGVAPTTPISGAHWRTNGRMFMAYNSQVYEYMLVPDGSMGAGQLLTVDPANTGYVFIDPPYELEYSQTAVMSVFNSTSAGSILSGGAQSLEPWGVGDVIEFRGSGEIDVVAVGTNNLTINFDIAGNTKALTRTMPNNIGNQRFEYYVRVVPVSSTAAFYYWRVYVGNSDTREPFAENETSGVTVSAPTFNLTAQWSVANVGNRIDVFQNTVEHKRKSNTVTP